MTPSGLRRLLVAAVCVAIATFDSDLGTPSLADESSDTRAALVQAVADAQKRFDALSAKETPEAIEAMQLVIAQQRELLQHLAETDADASSLRREVRSLGRSIARIAGIRERRQEFEQGQTDWASFAECCKQNLGRDCSEHWDALQEADALGRLATADREVIQEYLENRASIKNAVAEGNFEMVQTLARKDHDLCCQLFGHVVPRTITSLEYVAKVAHHRKQFDLSLELFEEALAKREQLYPAWHPTTDKSILSLGLRYESLGRLSDAESRYRRVGPSLSQWSCLIRLGSKYQRSGQTQDALRLFDETFTCCGETIGENHTNRALAGTYAGEIYRNLGNYALALDRLETCARIWEANKKPLDLANCLNSKALAEQLVGDLDSAEQSYLRAIATLADSQQVRGVELRRVTQANYAWLLQKTGRFHESQKIYESIIRETNSKAQLTSADFTMREDLARLYQSVGELAKAETLLDSLLEYRQRQPLEIARLHSLRGRFYLQLGNLDKADTELDAALSYLAEATNDTPSDTAAVQASQALVLLERNQLPAALTLYRTVLKSLSDFLGDQHVRCAEIYDQIAKVQRRLGEYAAAMDSHQRSIEIYEANYGPTHESVAWAHHRLGTTHFVFDAPEAARAAWQRSFDIKQRICQQTLPWLPEAQASAFLTSLTTNDSSAGRDTLLSTLSVDKQEYAHEAFHCVWHSRGLVLNAIADRQRQLVSMVQSPERAQLARVRQRLAQLSVYAGSEEGAQRATRDELLRSLNEEKESLERAIAELAQDRTDTPLADFSPSDLMVRLPKQTALVQLVRTQRWHPETGSNEVQKQTEYDAFVVSLDSQSVPTEPRLNVEWIALGDADEIDRHIDLWRQAVLSGSGGTRGKRVRKPGIETPKVDALASRQQLYEQVWQPIAEALGGRSRVIIVPDGAFHRLPWIALPGSQTDYLIEEVRITTTADGRQLAQLLDSQPSDAGAGRFLLIGGIEYDAELPAPEGAIRQKARETTWSFLQGTKAEIAAIGEVIPDKHSHTLVGPAALEETVKSELEKASVIHLATHGFFAQASDEEMTELSSRGNSIESRETTSTLTSRNPLLQCGLTLAGCNSDVWLDEQGLPIDSGQDGYLSAEEIMGMDLSSTQLVVLSACETGLGSIGNGEGVFGLQRALHISGVKSTIASGWKVDDRATQLLMTSTYEKMIGEGLTPADALHQAQILMLRHFNPQTGELSEKELRQASPYYWAAFSLSGIADNF